MSTVSAVQPETPVRSYADHGRPAWRRFLFTREMAIIFLLIVVLIVASVIVPKFATHRPCHGTGHDHRGH